MAWGRWFSRQGRLSRQGALAAVTLLVSGCLEVGLSGPDGQSSPTTEERKTPAETGDVEEGSCNAWKVSYCDAIEQCDAFADREQCEIDIGYVRCKEDAPFAWCDTEIRKSLKDDACGELPSECAPAEIADRTVPTQYCEDLHEEMCEWSLFCGYEVSVESCMATKDTSEPCDQYVAVWPGIEDCLEAWATLACDEAAPEICRGLFR